MRGLFLLTVVVMAWWCVTSCAAQDLEGMPTTNNSTGMPRTSPPLSSKQLEALLGRLPPRLQVPPWWLNASSNSSAPSGAVGAGPLPPPSAYNRTTTAPGAAKPDITNPGTAKPGGTMAPGAAKPDITMAPGTAKPGGTMAPGAVKPDGSMVIEDFLELVSNINSNSSSANSTTENLVCSRLLSPRGSEIYQSLLCSDEIVQALAEGTSTSYYDLTRCSPSNYDIGCLGGFFSPEPTEMSQHRLFLNAFYPAVQCCPGHYCPLGVVCMIPCSAGGYCPQVRPVLNDTFCAPYGTVAKPYIGCGGAETNFACPAGYYCHNTTERELCPAGFYCPSGSRKPQRCPILATCPPGASAPMMDMGGVAKVVGVLGVLFFFVVLGRHRSNRSWEQITARRQQSSSSLELSKLGGDDDDDNENKLREVEEQSLLLPGRGVLHRIDIELINLGVQLNGQPEDKWALNGVSGKLSAGRVTAIMGPSGAGKSVLLHTLAGRPMNGKVSGFIRINGCDDVSLADCRAVVGFVPQEDIMHRSLTVFENVDFNAQWRLPREMASRQRMNIVFAALDALGLDDQRVLRSRIGDEAERGVSGGERKRVNIGMELVAQPSLLLLDEPTSGLDASTSIDVVRGLKAVAQSGVNVVVVLHQPRVEILRLFDDLLLLAPGGRTVYAGPTRKAVDYFQGLGYSLPDQCNPADFFVDVISGSVARQGEEASGRAKDDNAAYLVERWEKQRDSESLRDSSLAVGRDMHNSSVLELQRLERQTAGVVYQTWLCTKRAIIQRTRELNTAVTDYCLVATAGLVLGLLFHAVELDKVPSVNLFISMALGFAATQQALRLFGAERTVFAREADAGINRLAYFLGKNLASLLDLFLLPFIFLSMFYSFSNPRGAFADYLVLLLAAQWALSGVGHVISVVLDPAKAQLAAVVVTLVLNGLSGFSPLKSELGQFGVVCYGSYSFWLTEALFLIEAEHYPDIYAASKSDIANMFDFDTSRSLVMHIGVLLSMGAACRLVCLLALEVTRRAWPSPLRLWTKLTACRHAATLFRPRAIFYD